MEKISKQHMNSSIEKRDQIKEMLKRNNQKFQLLKGKIVEFRKENISKHETKSAQTNQHQYNLYKQYKYFNFEVSFTNIEKKIKQIMQESSSDIQIKILEENIDKIITQLGKSVKFLEKCNHNLVRSKPSQHLQSFQQTIKYLGQIRVDIDQIHSNFIFIKESTMINPQQKTDLSKGARKSSPSKAIKIEQNSKTFSKSPIVNEKRKSVSAKVPSTEKQNQEEDNRSLEQMIKEIMDFASDSQSVLSILLPKIFIDRDISFIMYYVQMATIQNSFTRAAKVAVNMLKRVKEQTISKRTNTEETANSKSQLNMKTQNQQTEIIQLKADYDKKISELNKIAQNLRSETEILLKTLQDQSKQINEKNQLIKKLETKSKDLQNLKEQLEEQLMQQLHITQRRNQQIQYQIDKYKMQSQMRNKQIKYLKNRHYFRQQKVEEKITQTPTKQQKEQKLIEYRVQSLKKELNTLDKKLTQKQQELSSIEQVLKQKKIKQNEWQQNQAALFMESINFKTLVQETVRSCQTVNQIAKSKFSKNRDKVEVTKAELDAAKSQTSTFEANYKSLLQKLKSNPSDSKKGISLINNSGIKECLDAFIKYLSSEFNLIKLNLMTMIKQQHKADAEYSRLSTQIEDLSQMIQALAKQHESKQTELNNLNSALDRQKRNLQAAEQQYQTFMTNMFSSIAQAQRKKQQQIIASSNYYQILQEKQHQILQLRTKITLLQHQKSNVQSKLQILQSSNAQNQLKQKYEALLQNKADQISKLNLDKEKINCELLKQNNLLQQCNQENLKLLSSEKQLHHQIQSLQKQIQILNGFISRNQQAFGQNMQTFNLEKKKMQNQINELNEELIQKTTKISSFQNRIKDLEAKFSELNNRNRINLANQSQSNQELNAKLKQIEDDLERKQKQYDAKQRECLNLVRDLKDARDALNEQRRKISSGKQEMGKLRAEIDEILKEKRELQKIIQYLKEELNHFKNKNQALSNQLKTIKSSQQSAINELNQNRYYLKRIQLAIRDKLNLGSQISLPNLSETIRNFNPVCVVGCKLITSIIIHGYDAQRSTLINKIEAFSGRKIKRTDVLARYPEVKSMIFSVPKEGPFIMLYKTSADRVFGSFSQGLRRKTFIFAYWTEEEDRFGSITREASQIEFFMPENPSEQFQSVDLSDRKYLKYGRSELRINLMSMETISADSHVMNDKYYQNFKWTQILGDKRQDKVPLIQVELHKVDFE